MKTEEERREPYDNNPYYISNTDIQLLSSNRITTPINVKTVQLKGSNKEVMTHVDEHYNDNHFLYQGKDNEVKETVINNSNDNNNSSKEPKQTICKKHIVFDNKEAIKKNKRSSIPIPLPMPNKTMNNQLQGVNLTHQIYLKKKTLDPPRQLTPQITKRNESNNNINRRDSIKSHEETKSTITQKTISTSTNIILHNYHTNDEVNQFKSKDDTVIMDTLVNAKEINTTHNKFITSVIGIEKNDFCITSTIENTVSNCIKTESNNSNANYNYNEIVTDEMFKEKIMNLIHIQDQYELLYKNTKESTKIKKTEVLKDNLKKLHLKLQKQIPLTSITSNSNNNKKLKTNINRMRQLRNKQGTLFKKYETSTNLNRNKPEVEHKDTILSPINIYNIISNQNDHHQSTNNANNKDNTNETKNNKLYFSNTVQSHSQSLMQTNTMKEKDNTQLVKLKPINEPIRRYSSNIEESKRGCHNTHSRNVINKIDYPIHSATTIKTEESHLLNNINNDDDNNCNNHGLFYNYSNLKLDNDAERHSFQLTSPEIDYKFKYFPFNTNIISVKDPIKCKLQHQHQHHQNYYKQTADNNQQYHHFENLNNICNGNSEYYTITYYQTKKLNRNNQQTDLYNSEYNQVFYNTSNTLGQGNSFSSREKEIKEQRKQVYDRAFSKVDYNQRNDNRVIHYFKPIPLEDNLKRKSHQR